MATKTRLEQIEAMLADEPNDPELGYMLAMEHASQGNDARAADCFKDLMTRCADYAPAYHQGARTLARLNRIEEAKAALRQGIPAALKQNNEHAAGEMQELLASFE